MRHLKGVVLKGDRDTVGLSLAGPLVTTRASGLILYERYTSIETKEDLSLGKEAG